MRLFRADLPHSLRRRLWIGTSLVGLVVAIVVISQVIARLSDGSHRLEFGGDFVPAYAAGTLVREGRSAEVYRLDAMERVERRIVASADLEPLPFYGPYLNPPFFAAFYAPLSKLPYREAAAVWLGFSLLCIAVSIILLARAISSPSLSTLGEGRVGAQFRPAISSSGNCDRTPTLSPPQGTEGGEKESRTWRVWALIPLVLIISMPFIQTLCHLQNSGLSLLILTTVVVIWRRSSSPSSAIIAGLLASLLAYKPQLAALVMVSLSATLGWPALVGCVIGAGILAVATMLLMPGTISEYLHALPPRLRAIQQRPQYNWGRQMTPQGFWRLLLQGHEGGPARPITTILVAASVLTALAGFGWVLWRFRQQRACRDRLIAITICASPVLMPYFMDYDLLLLAIPAMLIARLWHERDNSTAISSRFVPVVWAGLFIVLYINPGLTGTIRVNFGALLTALTAIASAIALLKTEAVQSTRVDSDYNPLASAA